MNFWMALFGVLTIISAAGVVLARAPLNSALWLIMTLFFVAAHYAILGADFLSAVQVMVYAGAIMVLVVFVIMLLGADAHTPEKRSLIVWPLGIVTAGSFFAVLYYSISKGLPRGPTNVSAVDGSAAGLGSSLFSTFLVPFELTSLLILGAMIGAVVLGADKKRALKVGRGLKATRERVEAALRKAA